MAQSHQPPVSTSVLPFIYTLLQALEHPHWQAFVSLKDKNLDEIPPPEAIMGPVMLHICTMTSAIDYLCSEAVH